MNQPLFFFRLYPFKNFFHFLSLSSYFSHNYVATNIIDSYCKIDVNILIFENTEIWLKVGDLLKTRRRCSKLHSVARNIVYFDQISTIIASFIIFTKIRPLLAPVVKMAIKYKIFIKIRLCCMSSSQQKILYKNLPNLKFKTLCSTEIFEDLQLLHF